MNKSLDDLIQKMYEKYKGLPNGGPIVRENTKNDAFPIVVLDILYSHKLGIDMKSIQASDLAKIIVPPPDNGIDMVVVKEDLDEVFFEFVQVKNTDQTESELKQCFSYMKSTIKDFKTKPSTVNSHLSAILNESGFDKNIDKRNIKYIVVHRGLTSGYSALKDDEQIVTGAELDILRTACNQNIPSVPLETFESDCYNNFIVYDRNDNPEEEAILCNLRGYDLAVLSNKYSNTTLGRNILFGNNLRDSLAGKSKTYAGVSDTITKEPDKFWFYNNGITIVAEDYDAGADNSAKEKFVLKNFSIINGAQTTSSLGRYLREAQYNHDKDAINCLKKVYVLTRILKVKSSKLRSQIAIFNNTQNPITTRDMASNRDEQVALNKWLLNNGSNIKIYVEIRNGATVPANIYIQKHQRTSNVELAQLAFAGFLREPFTAKNKKSALFDTDYKQEEYLLNEYYHKIFHYSSDGKIKPEGILFNKTPEEINELLFVNFLYKNCKNYLRRTFKERIENSEKQLAIADSDNKRKSLEESIKQYNSKTAISNICLFYCLALYYRYKDEFAADFKDKTFDYNKFYSDSNYKNELIKKFSYLFLMDTINIISKLSETTGNLNTWIRSGKNEKPFLDKVDENLTGDLELQEKCQKFIESVMVSYNAT